MEDEFTRSPIGLTPGPAEPDGTVIQQAWRWVLGYGLDSVMRMLLETWARSVMGRKMGWSGQERERWAMETVGKGSRERDGVMQGLGRM